MSERRTDLFAWMQQSRAVEQDSLTLARQVEDTQSALGLDLAWWAELRGDYPTATVISAAGVHAEFSRVYSTWKMA